MRLRLEKPELGALTLALGIENLKDACVAGLVALPCKLQARLRSIPRVGLCRDELRVVIQRIEEIGNLPEGVEHDLLILLGACLQRIQRGPPLRPQRPAVEERLRQPCNQRPRGRRGVEQLPRGQRLLAECRIKLI